MTKTEREELQKSLKPCPFCGSQNVHLSDWTDQAYVYCAECDCKTDVYLHSGCAVKAVNKWNKRAVMKAKVRQAPYANQMANVCSTCGTLVLVGMIYCPGCGSKLEWKNGKEN